MKYALILILALASQVGMAQVILCPGLGDLTPDGNVLHVEYSEEMGFTDRSDTAYLVNVGQDSLDFRTSKWGALLSIPRALIDIRNVGTVTIHPADAAVERVSCTSL